jgi:hypothetical protein
VKLRRDFILSISAFNKCESLNVTLSELQTIMWRLFKKDKRMTFQPISLDNFCPTITYDFKFKNLRDTQLVDILIISFHGKYRDGSAGSPDAGLIKGIIKTGVSVFDPFSVLIDLTDLEYNWGDNLDLSFADTGPTKRVILVGDKCRQAMSSLEFGIGTNEDIVDNDLFFDDFDKAIAKLKEEGT